MRLQTAFHTSVVGWYLLVDLYGIYIGIVLLCTRWDIVTRQFGCGIQYISLWNMIVQEIYFIACLLEDLTSASSESKRLLHKKLTYVFQTIVFPLTLLVSTYFWYFYTADPGLLDEFKVLNDVLACAIHPAHSINVTLILLELIISDKAKYQVSSKYILQNSITIQFIYMTVIYCCYVVGNVWPYPILCKMSSSRLLLMGVSNSILCLILQRLIFFVMKNFINMSNLVKDVLVSSNKSV